MESQWILLTFYATLGLVQSLPGVAMSFFGRDELGLSPAAIGTATSVMGLPWIIKPAWGMLSDAVPLFGYRRKSYLLLASAVASALWVTLASVPATVAGTVALSLGVQAGLVMADVCADGAVVECVRRYEAADSDKGKLQAACWTARFAGSLVGSFVSGWAMDYISPRSAFGITAAPLAVMAVCASWYADVRVVVDRSVVPEPGDGWEGVELDLLTNTARTVRATRSSRVSASVRRVLSVLRRREVARPTCFLFLLAATPSSATSIFFFFTQPRSAGGLGFSGTFIGVLSVVGAAAGILGAQLYRRTRLRHVRLRPLVVGITLFVTLAQATELLLVTRLSAAWGLDDRLFVLTSDAIEDVVEACLLLPIMVMVARLCPPGIEASLYACIISVSNAGGMLSRVLGAAVAKVAGISMTDFSHLWVLSVVVTVTLPMPLLLVKWLPTDDPAHAQRRA